MGTACAKLDFNSLQYGPMNMSVAEGDIHEKIKRYAVFDDNMDVVLELVNRVHDRVYNVPDFDMVCNFFFNL